jgi:hypothetical protein
MDTTRNSGDVLGIDPQEAPPRRFFTPLSCCLGCAGLVVLAAIVFLCAGYWLMGKALVDAPIAIDMAPVPEADLASAKEKAAAIGEGKLLETTFSQNELNGLLRDFLANDLAQGLECDPALCKGRVELTADNQVKFALSVPVAGRYLNVETQSTIVIRNGVSEVSDVRLARIGALDSEWLTRKFAQLGRGRAESVVKRVEGQLVGLKVENGQAHVVFAPKARGPEK